MTYDIRAYLSGLLQFVVRKLLRCTEVAHVGNPMQHIAVNHSGAQRMRAEAEALGIEGLSFGRPFMGRIIVTCPDDVDADRLAACLDPSQFAHDPPSANPASI